MEYIRSITVTITVDTNKTTRTRTLSPDDDETNEEFVERIRRALEEVTE